MTRTIGKKASNARAFEGANPNGKRTFFAERFSQSATQPKKTTER
jgi:hypothetical protein